MKIFLLGSKFSNGFPSKYNFNLSYTLYLHLTALSVSIMTFLGDFDDGLEFKNMSTSSYFLNLNLGGSSINEWKLSD